MSKKEREVVWFTQSAKWDHTEEIGIVPEFEPGDVHRQHSVGHHLPMPLLYGDFSRLSYLPAKQTHNMLFKLQFLEMAP